MTQLDLFAGAAAPAAASPEGGAETAPRIAPSIQAPPRAEERAGDALAPAGVPIPARCPVTNGRTCHRDSCRHYRTAAGGLCAHPEAPAASRRRRSRKPAR